MLMLNTHLFYFKYFLLARLQQDINLRMLFVWDSTTSSLVSYCSVPRSPPSSPFLPNTPLNVYCVNAQRWTLDHSELRNFSSSGDMLTGMASIPLLDLAYFAARIEDNFEMMRLAFVSSLTIEPPRSGEFLVIPWWRMHWRGLLSIYLRSSCVFKAFLILQVQNKKCYDHSSFIWHFRKKWWICFPQDQSTE